MILAVQPGPQLSSVEQLVAVVAELRAEVERRRADNARLRAENAELRRRLGLNSSNSSKPPAPDGLARPRPQPGKGEGSGQRRGKQPGAPLGLVADPDRVVQHRPDRRAGPACRVQHGTNVEAAAVYARAAQIPPYGRGAGLMTDLLRVGVSVGFVHQVVAEAARRLGPFVSRLTALLYVQDVLHADETPARACGGFRYVHVACTPGLTLFHVGGWSAADVDAGGVLPGFTGTLVRDGYAAYRHLTEAGHDTLTADEIRHSRACYAGAVAYGREQNPPDRDGRLSRAGTLVERFATHRDMILRFTVDLAVPFTNNQAERDLCPVKLQQKISATWRTLQCLADVATLRSSCPAVAGRARPSPDHAASSQLRGRHCWFAPPAQSQRTIFVPFAVPQLYASRQRPDWTPLIVPPALRFHC